jgi:hypothetical protein
VARHSGCSFLEPAEDQKIVSQVGIFHRTV